MTLYRDGAGQTLGMLAKTGGQGGGATYRIINLGGGTHRIMNLGGGTHRIINLTNDCPK